MSSSGKKHTGKFTKIIKNIKENNDFFNIDYNDLIHNFSKDDEESGRDKVTMELTIQNLAFVDSIRGDIPRNRFIDKLLTNFRHEFIVGISDYNKTVEDFNDKGE